MALRLSRNGPIVVVATMVIGFAGAVIAPQMAGSVGASQPTLVSVTPAAFTPNVANGTVYGLAQVGSWIVVGGSFTSVTPHGGSTVTRNRVFAFDQATGALAPGFAPNVDGTVNAVIAGPTPNTVYLGGAFTNVNGVRSKSVALLNLSDGSRVNGFQPAPMNGIIDDLRLVNGHLWVVGGFTTLAGVSHQGIGTLVPGTGALDPYVNVQLTGHHNFNGTGANGALGGRAMDINAAGTRAVIVGNFKNADGVVHDQIVLLDLGATSATVDPTWNTSQYSARCSSNSFDTYVEDVDFAPNGSYFAVVSTGGSTFSTNIDGTRGLCDTAARWEIGATGTNVKPSWIDYTGNDTFWSVAATGTAIYAGGHARWINNPLGSDSSAAGAVPRPGLVALDPVNGLPFRWNPGRNPRGVGTYALLATDQGLYTGSDTDWIGNRTYLRQKLAFFPLAGGETPPSTATSTLPGNVYQAGPMPGGSTTSPSADLLTARPVNGSTVGASSTVSTTGTAWGATRGAFMVGGSLFWPSTDGNVYQATFDGSTVGTPAVVDPYNDPYWSTVDTGSGQTYRGVKSNYYSEISKITGQFYAAGRIYYSLSGASALFYRYFEPDDGVVGGTEFTVSGADFSNVSGMTLSSSTLYYARRTDGTLHTMSFVNGVPNGATDTTFNSTVDWRARSLFLFGGAPPANIPPVASATVNCSALTCSFDATSSHDPDGSVQAWSWNFGDGSTGTGPTISHGYAGGGTRTVTLTVTDNDGGTGTWTGSATTIAPDSSVRYAASTDVNGPTAAPAVTIPSGVSAGDTELLFVSVNAAGTTGTPSGLTGWTQLAKITNATLETTVFRRTAATGDSGQQVTVPLTASALVDVAFADYSGVSSAPLPLTSAIDNTTSTHTTPSATVTASGSWVLSYWSDRSTGTTAWTVPSVVTARQIGIGTGGGHVTGVLADSNAPVATGTYPALTATTNSTSGRGNMISVVLAPGP